MPRLAAAALAVAALAGCSDPGPTTDEDRTARVVSFCQDLGGDTTFEAAEFRREVGGVAQAVRGWRQPPPEAADVLDVILESDGQMSAAAGNDVTAGQAALRNLNRVRAACRDYLAGPSPTGSPVS